MNTDERGPMDSLTESVLGAVFEVSNTLGGGFLERVYQRALFKELSIRGLGVVAQAVFPVMYKGENVGEYYADFLVEDVLLLELKCVEHLAIEHTAQCLNYLRASGRTLCLLINFQRPKVEWRRVVRTAAGSNVSLAAITNGNSGEALRVPKNLDQGPDEPTPG